MKTTPFTDGLALAVAAGLLLVGCSGSPDAAGPQPTVTVTTTAPAPPARTVEVAPAACKAAIETARKIAGVTSEFATAGGLYPPLVSEAFDAGVSQDVEAAQKIIETMESANADLQAAADSMEPLAETFNAQAAACR